MKLMRYKAQDEGQGSHCGTYTVLLVSEGRKWAYIVYIDAGGLCRTRVPQADVAKWMTEYTYYTERKAIQYFLRLGVRMGISKVLKTMLKARLAQLKAGIL